jgi:hypothetical protein
MSAIRFRRLVTVAAVAVLFGGVGVAAQAGTPQGALPVCIPLVYGNICP